MKNNMENHQNIKIYVLNQKLDMQSLGGHITKVG